MLRRASVCLVLSLLLLAPACRKKDGEAEADAEADKKADKTDKAATVDQPATPTPTPTQPTTPTEDATKTSGGSGGGSGGAVGGSGGGGGGVPREDLTCDPEDKGDCLEGEQCIGGQGCDEVWTCDADIVCKKGVKEYCGCDGRTFEAVFGNCPWKKYQYEGPCK